MNSKLSKHILIHFFRLRTISSFLILHILDFHLLKKLLGNLRYEKSLVPLWNNSNNQLCLEMGIKRIVCTPICIQMLLVHIRFVHFHPVQCHIQLYCILICIDFFTGNRGNHKSWVPSMPSPSFEPDFHRDETKICEYWFVFDQTFRDLVNCPRFCRVGSLAISQCFFYLFRDTHMQAWRKGGYHHQILAE